ncbi:MULTISPECIES: DNA primase [Psychrilyobacter]|uniref:DNA primase n=1 Tax=Psychrilyobacter piezotolerans TaxID=2293438 RepID=A0ABX9KGU9_9FUSO|nr:MULTISPECIES: DNA primase [Psychrilyobacter]MCS5420368.1 DNA primase [Psychrilyobacter sp. S5]NDI78050.1 DNA primase [Psychrilyobacter piezotolerans]RDE61641.1 DNA primase [Psychrilyobacter sp. S5]REI41033.1 DNA primase [Psychrilyobacter piezotolerans]
MRFRNEDLDKVITQLNIVEVIGEYVDLKKTGSNYKGLCPFHKDTNPSFMVSTSKNIYKCFVCGAGGNVIKFYMEYNKLTYGEAVYELSKKYNIDISPISGNSSEDRNKKYYKILDEALSFFKGNIFSNSGREALSYLNNRGMKPDFIRENNLGYALNGWDSLYNYLTGKGYDPPILSKLGLIKSGDKGYYDTFRDRIIYPIYSPGGNVIAFGGRTMSDRKEIAKYLNSPETPVFHKGRNLYGIKNKGSSIRRKNYAILMEGYMDVLAAHAYGFDVALAPLGTAFSSEQAELLKRYTSNVIIAFDMDNAGRVASEKASLVLKKYGFNIRVLELKNAKDPDEFLKKYGKTEFLKSVKNSKEIFDFLYSYYVREYDLSNFMAKQNFIGRFKEFFQSVETDLEKSLYLNKLSVSLGMEKEVEILKKILILNNEDTVVPKRIERQPLKTKSLKIDELELETLKLCLKDRKYFERFKNKTITSPFVQNIFDTIEQNGEQNYIQELLRGNFFKLEEEEEEIILNISTELSAKNEDDIINTYIEVYKRWFVKEIDEKMSFFKKNDIKSFLNCKKIYEKIIGDIKIDDLEENYKEFISMKI